MTFFPDGTANVVIAGPGAAEGLPERSWPISEHRLVGRQSCGVALAPGWADYREPKAKHQWFETARGDGAIWLGAVIEPRRFSLPLYVHRVHGTRSLHTVEESFWADIWYEYQSRLFVNSPAGTRFCDFRLDEEPRETIDHDRAFDQFVPFLVPVVVEQSWWRHLTEQFVWTNGLPVQGRVLYNPGDRPAAPIVTLKGPGVFQIPDGNSGAVVTTPNLLPGEVVVMHTDFSITPKSNRRSNFYGDLGGQRFRTRVPGRRPWDLSLFRCIGGNSASSAVLEIEPKSRRPM